MKNISVDTEEIQHHRQYEKQKKRQSHQLQALFLKNVTLQSKQICTNICHIFTPIICLIFTFLIHKIMQDNIPTNKLQTAPQYPYRFNDYQIFDVNNNNSRDKLQWYLYSCIQNCEKTLLGQNDGESKKSGILGNVSNSSDQKVSFNPNPYSDKKQINKSVPFFQSSNDSLNKDLFNRNSRVQKGTFQQIEENGLDFIPDGAFQITQLSMTKLNANVKVNDIRDLSLHRSNAITKINETTKNGKISTFITAYGFLNVMHVLTSAYIKTVTENTQIYSGYILMPDIIGGIDFIDNLINSVGAIVFPLALSLLFPVFLYGIVLQKQQKLIQMMKMNGMKMSNYWLIYFLFNFLISLITNLFFFGTGYFILATPFFTRTSSLLLLIIIVGWMLCQIGLAVFFQTFLNKSRTANIIGYLISIWTSLIGATLNIGMYPYPGTYPLVLKLFPPFAFVRLFYIMLTVCSDKGCYASISDINEQMEQCIIFMYTQAILFFLLGTYLFEVIPQQFGVRKSVLFPFNMFCKCCLSKKDSKNEPVNDQQLRDYISVKDQDQLAQDQRKNVLKTHNISNYSLVINNLRKLYKKQGYEGMYPAVRSFNLLINRRETFGLLGPNGAGKTTLISMITGMYEADNGSAWIGGFNISTQREKAQLEMGVCPQFDLLWPQLTVEEHLYFYARLKGVSRGQIHRQVSQALDEVNLLKFRKFLSSALSGGMKRRLSVAISLVGDPEIVFLDQPSTGLDPQNRRQLWEVIANCQSRRSIFLTTHMMQQADTLCNRVGIITNGALRTVGNQIKLKNIYGGGYRISVNSKRESKKLICRESLNFSSENNKIKQISDQDMRNSIISLKDCQKQYSHQRAMLINRKIISQMNKIFPGTKLEKQFKNTLIFKVPSNYFTSYILETLSSLQSKIQMADFAITNSSLEDVFMKVVDSQQAAQYQYTPSDGNIDGRQFSQQDDSFKSIPSEKQNYHHVSILQKRYYDQDQSLEIKESVISAQSNKYNRPQKKNHSGDDSVDRSDYF